MKSTTEFEIKVSGARIIEAKVLEDGTCKLIVEPETEEKLVPEVEVIEEDYYIRLNLSDISLNDEFMGHKPRTNSEKIFKNKIAKAIRHGLKDILRPKYDPSFTDSTRTRIQYKAGEKPAVAKSYNWYSEIAEKFCPERGSRLGTKYEYLGFLAWLIKKLMKSGWSRAEAWNAICNDSKELGHYWNSINAKHELENTGCREICGFFDLANTYKILAEDKEIGGFWLAGGLFNFDGSYRPLAGIFHSNYRIGDNGNSVGWIVLEK